MMSESDLSIKRRAKRMTGQQLVALVDSVCRDNSLHTEKFMTSRGKEGNRRKWSQVADLLNDLGPGKNWKGWRQAWIDLKNRTKARARDLQFCKDDPSVVQLTPLELKIMKVIGSVMDLEAGEIPRLKDKKPVYLISVPPQIHKPNTKWPPTVPLPCRLSRVMSLPSSSSDLLPRTPSVSRDTNGGPPSAPQNSTFRDTTSQNATFHDATPHNVIYHDASQNVTYHDTSQNVTFQNPTPKNATFHGATHKNATFHDATPRNSTFQDAAPRNVPTPKNITPRDAAVFAAIEGTNDGLKEISRSISEVGCQMTAAILKMASAMSQIAEAINSRSSE